MVVIRILKEGTRFVVTATLGAVTGLVGSLAYILMSGVKCLNTSNVVDVEIESAKINIQQVLKDFEAHKNIHVPLDVSIEEQGFMPCEEILLWGTVATTALATTGLLCWYGLNCIEKRNEKKHYLPVTVNDIDSDDEIPHVARYDVRIDEEGGRRRRDELQRL